MDKPSSTTGVRPPPAAPPAAAADLVDNLEDDLARKDLAAAQAQVRGEEWAIERFWKLHVRAKRLRHPTWAAAFLARVQVAQAHEREARAAARAAVEQIERVQAHRKLRSPARGKAAARDRDLVRVVEAFAKVEENSKQIKKAVAVDEALGMSLPTYRAYVAEARARGLLP